ncbi:hypothetical protein P879_05877 [Paragonimus westermani]|uniref:Uncharacterized protein n=1 Tax=Paragonimus westermani TaxID=34504 RepID=A0A8T0DVD2_9TREM|nr:hypothetical protein P879_05877 [Paragonimus westermani]
MQLDLLPSQIRPTKRAGKSTNSPTELQVGLLDFNWSSLTPVLACICSRHCVELHTKSHSVHVKNMTTDLETSFNAFCNFVKKGSNTATDKTLKKICTDCHIYSKGLDANRVDIEFRAHIGNTKRYVLES